MLAHRGGQAGRQRVHPLRAVRPAPRATRSSVVGRVDPADPHVVGDAGVEDVGVLAAGCRPGGGRRRRRGRRGPRRRAQTGPGSARGSRAGRRRRVDLPAPLGPTTATRRPGGRSRSMSCRAGASAPGQVTLGPSTRTPIGAAGGATGRSGSADDRRPVRARRAPGSALARTRPRCWAAAGNAATASNAAIGASTTVASRTPGSRPAAHRRDAERRGRRAWWRPWSGWPRPAAGRGHPGLAAGGPVQPVVDVGDQAQLPVRGTAGEQVGRTGSTASRSRRRGRRGPAPPARGRPRAAARAAHHGMTDAGQHQSDRQGEPGRAGGPADADHGRQPDRPPAATGTAIRR